MPFFSKGHNVWLCANEVRSWVLNYAVTTGYHRLHMSLSIEFMVWAILPKGLPQYLLFEGISLLQFFQLYATATLIFMLTAWR